MKELFLIRGISGSGKSTLAKTLATMQVDMDEYSHTIKFPVFSADDYFMVDGEYMFDGSKLKDAHADCQAKTEVHMKRGYFKIFVTNTFTREWEMKVYYDLAETHGYRVYSIIVENRHGGVNEHGVPDESVQAMKDRFEILL